MPLNAKQCKTVKQLKELIKDWPELRADGEPTEVWIGKPDGLSNQCTHAIPLNVRNDNEADIIFEWEE